MKEYTKRDSCMTMEEVIERNTGMSLKAFLTPQPNPYIHNMDRAVEFFKKKVNDAAEEKEILQIKIVGDYDADGMNASAILYDAIISYLKANSLAEYAEVSVRLPRRYSEGYGLSKKIIDESESGLIITVDNGIAAIDAIKKAKDKGIDVIILDHHLSGEELPCADIIVDPHCEGMSTFKHYCGAGLAYRFAEMLITNKDLLDKLLVLAGIATVADVVPLIGANRYLVRQSLKLINRGIATSGVLALVRKMRLEKITAEDYGYKIGPVCNASGRLLDDGAMDIFHLLSQELDVFALDYDEQLLKLHALADTVIERNVDRRRITEEALERSDALISQQCLADDAVYIIYDTQVSEGVMGIVAGKLAEKYMRPVIVFAHAQDGEKLKGSGRTYGNIHLKNQVLDPCKEYFFAYGGHAGAAGMTIPEKNLMLFRNKVRKLDIPVLYREKRILYDLEVTKEEIPELYEKMEFFAPFGEGNPEPVFFIRNLELSPVRGKFYEQNGSDGKSIKLFTMPYPSSGYQMAAEYLLMDAPKKIDMTFEVYTIYSHGKEHTVCLQAAERRIPITHSQKIKGASMKSTLPLKACPGTVVPIIFASSILTFPSMIAAFIGKENLTALKFLNTSYWFQKENFYYSIGAIFYIAMIIGFSFYYAEIIFNPTEVAMDLKKKGANVYSIRPGKETAAYLHKKSNEVVLIGAVGLCVIAMVPAVLSGIWHLSGIAFLGTSIVITVGVSLEFRTQCIAKSQNGKYSSMLEKGGIF